MRKLTLFLVTSIFFTFSLLLLASCQESRTENQVIPSQLPPKEIESTSINPIDFNDFPTITPIPESLIAPQPQTTSTQSVLEKSEAFSIPPTPTFQIPLPEIQGAPSQYSIRSPSIETLINLQLYRTSQGVISDSPIDDLLYPTFHDVLDYEWKNAYTHQMYSPELITLLPHFNDHSRGRLTNNMLIDLIGDNLVWFLNEYDVKFDGNENYEISNFSGRVYQIEIDDDSNPEWLIEVRDTEGFYLSSYSFWITLNQIEDAHYERLENQIPWIWGRTVIPEHPFNFRDFTGDGIMDIVIIEYNCRIGTCDGEIHITAGNSGGLSLLPSTIQFTDDSDGAAKNISILEWSLSPENNLPVLKLMTYTDIGWECTVSKTQEIQWENNKEHISIRPTEYFYQFDISGRMQETSNNHSKPPHCAIAQAVLPENQSIIDYQIQLLESTLAHFDQFNPEEKFFVLFRLSILSAIQKDYENAEFYLEQTEANIKLFSNPFIMALMDEVEMSLSGGRINPFELCLAAEKIFREKSTSKEYQFDIEKTLPNVGYPTYFSNQLCDSRVILLEILKSLQIKDYHSLEKAIDSAGLKESVVKPMFIENPDSGWLVVINDNNLDGTNHEMEVKGSSLYIYLYSKAEGWIELFYTPSTTTTSYNFRDISGDGIMDFLLAKPGTNPETSNCYSTNHIMEVFLITALTDEWLVSYSETVCLDPGTSLEFSNYFVDSDQNGIIDVVQFYFEENLFDLSLLEKTETKAMWELVTPPFHKLATIINKDVVLSAIAEEIITSKSKFNIFQELEYLQDIWVNNDPIGRYIQAQTNYLLGLSYEQDGEISRAAELFFEIWKNQSDTIWGNLASSRLTK